MSEDQVLWTSVELALKNPQAVHRLSVSEDEDQVLFAKHAGKFTELEELHLPDSTTGVIPAAVFALKHLRKLDMGHDEPYTEITYLEELPPQIGQLMSLEELHLRGQARLTSLPKEIGALTKLRILNLDASALRSLPDEIGNLVALEELSLRWCLDLDHLPDALCNLGKLQKLELMQLKITSMPACLPRLCALKRLNLNFCRHLGHVPSSVLATLSLRELLVRDTGLHALPKDLVKLNLTLLDLARNPLVDIASLSKNTTLTRLLLGECGLNAVPAELSALTGLTHLDLIANNISALPATLRLPALETLDLRRNPIEDKDVVRAQFPQARILF